MATRKVTITLDEEVYRAIKNNTKNVSAAVNKMAIHYVAMEKQRRALAELQRQLAEEGIERDEEQVQEMVAFLDEVRQGIREAYGSDS